jgi:predicted nucleic acid-binding protein
MVLTALKLARDHGWDDLRDAEYLAIARLQADALVTVDAELATRAEGIVTIAPVPALVSAS